MAFNKTFKRKIFHRLAGFVVALTLASCSGRHKSPESTQVAAKVGSYEITEFQVDNAIARIPNIPHDQISAARLGALESLVKEQLIVQQAQSEKIDRQPQVVAAIDKARRDVISRAYLSEIVQAQTKPSEEEIHQYYTNHPELFSARRLYSVKEITTAASPETSEYLRDFTSSGKTLDQFGQWLQQRKTPFQAASGSRNPESLPISLLPQLGAAKDGSVVVFKGNSAFYVAQVIGTRPAPVSEDKAIPNIERFLTAQRSKAAIDREIARLQAATKIEFEGEFASASPRLTTSEEPLPLLSDQGQTSAASAATSVTK